MCDAALERDRLGLVRPGVLGDVDEASPVPYSTVSVERLSPLTLLTPATYRPSHFTRNLKLLYGSKRVGLSLY